MNFKLAHGGIFLAIDCTERLDFDKFNEDLECFKECFLFMLKGISMSK